MHMLQLVFVLQSIMPVPILFDQSCSFTLLFKPMIKTQPTVPSLSNINRATSLCTDERYSAQGLRHYSLLLQRKEHSGAGVL